MNKNTISSLLLIVVFCSCINSEQTLDKLAITNTFYESLNKSNTSSIEALLTDSLLTKETEYDYIQIFSKKEYLEWIKWDSVFEPTYKILDISQENRSVTTKVSKTDKRISFLHEEPIVMEQVINFKRNKIVSIETTKYLIFNDSVFVKNRDELVNWIAKHHPKLNGFINDQTKKGGMNYLKAIALYKKNNLPQ